MNIESIKMLGKSYSIHNNLAKMQNKVFRNLKQEAITSVARLDILIFQANTKAATTASNFS